MGKRQVIIVIVVATAENVGAQRHAGVKHAVNIRRKPSTHIIIVIFPVNCNRKHQIHPFHVLRIITPSKKEKKTVYPQTLVTPDTWEVRRKQTLMREVMSGRLA